ncbi:hypothetical protein Verru16b_00491 [Lacunisphaera limnophila]|uniref:Uncharacterized protein n=1 Tax=Lacunisphaera limnophila TaxID=1838286 RepID=A0A1D8ARD3_9BACT|nr:hypothetical protein [Lacunisphaera limnophila]AOS43446.1 hypothetical protein Verru16b_00491 [Lacunisphaera limnophila]
MTQSRFSIKRRVWVGLITGLAGVGAWGWWLQSKPVPPPVRATTASPFVQLAGAGTTSDDRILQERAELLDPTPLFFPTQWNYGQTPLSQARQRLPGEVFGSFDPKLTVSEQAIAPYGLELAPVPEKLADVLVQGNEAPFAGMGQIDRPQSTLAVRSGFLEIRELKSGKAILLQSLTGIQPPRSDYAPVEFLVVVGNAGLIGDLILTGGSGWDEVDGFFRNYLVRSYHLGERLPPGRYRVVVGA